MIVIHFGFARGHYVRRSPRIKLESVSVGKNCHGGLSLQLHLKAGIRYVDFVLWKWRPWVARLRSMR